MTVSTAPAALWRIAIAPARPELDAHAAAILRDVHELGLPRVVRIASSRVFLLEGSIDEKLARSAAQHLLADPVTERGEVHRGGDEPGMPGNGFDAAIEVHLKGGVMDPVAASTLTALADMGVDTSGLAVSTARVYRLAGVRSLDEVELIARRLLSNDCIEEIYLSGFSRHDARPDHLPVAPERPFELRHVPIRERDEAALMRLSREGHLFLSLEEMQAIRAHYREQQRDPTELELEMFAQTWSEHCVHKTLKSSVRYVGAPLPASSRIQQKPADGNTVEILYENLLKETVARATHELMDSGRVDWCLSVFEDNAGVIAFDGEYGVAFKVETHNHPSAIEPYGGAATGAGGCIRDVMGCGLGAKPIANTDIFCVGEPDFPLDLLPKGVLHPRRILKGVVSGVRDYGNRMGIPTVNGAVLFDNRYLGNPLVFCGCVGLMPRSCVHKEPQPGDLIVVIGGRTGRDGIHGATFSSAELTDTHADEFSHAVQIGNAITEKQVLDVMMQARDHADGCLYTATTDCGAGGLSSAVGEMGEKLGADVELSQVPLKYAGLRYDEIWISEAQERMVLSVPEKNWPTLRAICEAESVEATVIGTFRDDGRLVIRYEGQTVGDIDAHFLHNGIPRSRRKAEWTPPSSAPSSTARPGQEQTIAETLIDRLSRLNAASKEWIIRQYDHEVQGGSVIKSLVGPGEGPSDGAVLRPRLDSDRGIALACGIAPELSDVDPYWMAVAGIDEAIRNTVCVGGNPARTAILDNFCWGNCEDAKTMGALVRACQGCYDAAITYGTPFISGKDSLNNEFALDAADAQRLAGRMAIVNQRVRIPATLLISAMSIVDNVNQCVTMDAKPDVDGESRFVIMRLAATHWSEVAIEQAAALHAAVHRLIIAGDIRAAHDGGEDGALVALAEMAFAGRCGMDVTLDPASLPAGIPCGYVLQIPAAKLDEIMSLADSLAGVSVGELARLRNDDRFVGSASGTGGFDFPLEELDAAWRRPLAW